MQHTFSKVTQILEKNLKRDKPGWDAQRLMAPIGRDTPNLEDLNFDKVKQAAVLALITPLQNGEAALVLTKRVLYPGVHSGQMSFPGGRKEKQDKNFEVTALRETHEEIGVTPKQIKVAGELSPLYIPPSNFYVQPFVGFAQTPLRYQAQVSEVDTIFEIPFSELLNKANLQKKTIHKAAFTMNAPAFVLQEQTVWGATAMMLSELLEIYRNGEHEPSLL